MVKKELTSKINSQIKEVIVESIHGVLSDPKYGKDLKKMGQE